MASAMKQTFAPQGSGLPMHHPSDEMLLEYAAGSMAEPLAVLVATHMALCPLCRDRVAAFEAVGGEVLDAGEQIEVADDLLDQLMAKLDGPDALSSVEAGDTRPPSGGAGLTVPLPLRDYLPGDVEALSWRGRGVGQCDLLPERDDYQTRLLRVKQGMTIPSHTHHGIEATLVLTGAFTDEGACFARGDVALADASVDHSPVAEMGEDCICLAVTGGPLRLTGPFGRLLNPFVNI